jgi:hypothetical protein
MAFDRSTSGFDLHGFDFRGCGIVVCHQRIAQTSKG